MCGIAGFFALNDSAKAPSRDDLIRMRDTMIHRGPDGGGIWTSSDGRVGLAHRRLSIIDLSQEANQPMCNEDGNIQVVFNGEIYNHVEIRRELEAIGGHTWKTSHSDTEMLIHAFEQWGIDCIHRFRGMFAIAIWDRRKGEFWLIRDRLGVKPLVYTIHQGCLLFASEIKALIEFKGVPRKINELALYHYLSFLTSPGPDTLFDGVKKLSPGSWIKFNVNGHVTESKYWDVWDYAGPLDDLSEEGVTRRILKDLETAVNYRKVSDVPVGVFLSGGIDSTTNAALFSRGEGGPVKAFSIGYDADYGSYKNELHYAQMAAKSVGAEYFERKLTQKDLLDFLPEMIWLQDEPIADPVCVPVYYVSKLARDNGVIVCQVGEGADELFWGYPTWKLKLQLQTLHNRIPAPRWLKGLGLNLLSLAGRGTSQPYEALRRSYNNLPIFWGGAEAFTEAGKQRLLSPRLREQFKDVTSWDAIEHLHRRFKAKAWDTSDLNWMTYLDLNLRLPELLLMRVDKMSMGVSLEGRVPFLDHEFVTTAMSIPAAMKTKNGTLKYLLKKAVRGLIPDEIIDRPKQGFGVPVNEWLAEGLGDLATREIDDFLHNTDLFDPKSVREVMEQRKGHLPWYLLNLALWWKKFIA
jgi:asparagine synthase (glutamine-hydrolysing)